ncbi:MAG: MarR family transcriptional regulator [Clostridia bacterium]
MKSKNTINFFEVTQRVGKAISNIQITDSETHKGEFATLKRIYDNDEMGRISTITSLSKELCVSVPAVSQMINALEEKGLVVRVPSETDRRIVKVKLTDSGNDFLKRSLDILFRYIDDILYKMGENDSTELISLLLKLETLMQKGQ